MCKTLGTLRIQYWLDLFHMFYINKGLIFSCFVYFLCGGTQYVFWAHQPPLYTYYRSHLSVYTSDNHHACASPFAVGVEWAIERDHITDIGKSFFYYTDTRQSFRCLNQETAQRHSTHHILYTARSSQVGNSVTRCNVE